MSRLDPGRRGRELLRGDQRRQRLGRRTVEAITASHPEVRLIASDTNLGFANGVNLAAAEATGEYLLLLNPDTLVHDGTIDRLVAFARAHPEHGLVGGEP